MVAATQLPEEDDIRTLVPSERRLEPAETGRSLRRSVALALAAGVSWALAAPPRSWWPLLPLGVAALALALRDRSVRARAMLGVVAGVIFYASTLSWLTDFSPPGFVAMVVLETALLAGACALVPAGGAGRWGGGWWGLPAVLVLLEALQTRFPLGGFPLPALSLSQAGGPFAAAAPLGGALAVTGTAAAAGLAVAAVLAGRGRARVAVTGVALLVAVVPVAAGAVVRTAPAGTLDVAIVQGGGPRGVRAVFTDPGDVTDRHLSASAGVRGTPDLVVLPENVVTVEGPVAGSVDDRRFAALASRLGATVVVGVVESEGDGFRNAAVLWAPDGRIAGRYEKEHRVPFGEYIPARELLERVTDATALVPRDAIEGQGLALLRSDAAPLGVVISYEVFFADRVREAARAGAQVVLVPTNASSYVTDEVPAVEVAAARLRAREFGRTVLQAAPTGYSVIVLPGGEVVTQSGLGTAEVLSGTIPLRTGLTPYASVGDAPVAVLAVTVLLAGPLAALRRRREHRSSPPASVHDS